MVGYAFHYKNRIASASNHALIAETEKTKNNSMMDEEENKFEADGKEMESGSKKIGATSGCQVAVIAPWLEALLRKEFFGLCEEHKDQMKSEVNLFCIECKTCMCPHCLAIPSCHVTHRRLQIRRYIYQDVVRIHDMQQFTDCSKVQPYTVNGAKVVLLKPRKNPSKPKKNSNAFACEICRQSITEPNCYCSIACKVGWSLEITNLGDHAPTEYDKSNLALLQTRSDDGEAPLKQVEDEVDVPSMAFSLESSIGKCEGNVIVNHPHSRRMHSRKGIPKRAPLH